MAEIVNLRNARKRKARQERQRVAEENRIRHGLPGHERRAAGVERERLAKTHEAHRRQPADDAPPKDAEAGNAQAGDADE